MSAEGFAVIPNWLVRDGSVSGRAKMIFLVLSSHTGMHGTWWISHQAIAEEAGCSVSTVIRALNELRAKGAVSWVQRADKGGLLENSYRIHMTVGSSHPRQDPTVTSDTTLLSPVTEGEEEPQEEPQELLLPDPRPSGTLAEQTLDSGFDEFWAVYPRRIEKAAAKRRFAYWQARVGTPRIVEAAQRYARQVVAEKRTVQHIKYPASWLNTEPWEDDVTETVTATTEPGVTLVNQTLTAHDLVERWSPRMDYDTALTHAGKYLDWCGSAGEQPTHDAFAGYRKHLGIGDEA